jgi:TolB protein
MLSRRWLVPVLAVVGSLFALTPAAHAAFPGLNGRITFVTGFDDEEIFDVGADGSQQRNLTNNPAQDFAPAYSPDGRRVAFGSFRAWDPLGGGFVANSGELYVMNADGSNVRRVTVNAVPDGYPAWSPDGERLVFARPQRQQLPDEDLPPTDLWNIVLKTGEERQLTDTALTDEIRPRWSPDGQQIAFESDARKPDDYDVYTIRPDGRDLRQLTSTSGFDGEADYSPDGGHIVFSSERSGNSDIFVMRSDGSRQTQLTGDRRFDGLGCFSPDGQYIAFTSERDGHRVPGGGFFYPDIFRMRADGSQQTNLTKSPSVANFDPDWQPLPAP